MPPARHSDCLRRLRELGRDRQGAAMLEFLLVLTPLLVLFLCTLELTRLAIAELMLQRAAGIAVRACAVMKEQPENCEATSEGEGEGKSESANAEGSGADAQIEFAASEALKPLPVSSLRLTHADCEVKKGARWPSDWDSLAAEARFHCIVPLASAILCSDTEPNGSSFGGGERTRVIKAAARYTHQGARYNCRFSEEAETPFGKLPDPELDSNAGDVGPWNW